MKCAMRRIPVIIGSILLAVGLAIFLCDSYMNYRYGFGINDVVGMTALLTGRLERARTSPSFPHSFMLWGSSRRQQWP